LNTPPFTVELWAKVTGGTSYRSPLTSRADNPQRGYIFYADPANTWQFWTGKGDTSGWDNIAGPAVQTNAWAHLVGGYDGTNKFFYVNGVLIGTKSVAFGPNDEDVLRFGGGATESDGNYFFEGDVDEVSFYAKALSQAQIVQHFVAGRPLQTGPSIDRQNMANLPVPS
jgi:Concanavalin A-like lectin/glucanases superfamily